MTEKKIRIFIIEDHKIHKDSMIGMPAGQNPDTLCPDNISDRHENDLTVVGTGGSYNQFFERLEQMPDKIDVLLLDTKLPRESFGYLEGIMRVMEGRMVILVPGNYTPEQTPDEIELTDMEKSVLHMTVDGLNAGEISRHLGITQPNVERYQRILRKKFDVTNVASLVREAIGRGFYA